MNYITQMQFKNAVEKFDPSLNYSRSAYTRIFQKLIPPNPENKKFRCKPMWSEKEALLVFWFIFMKKNYYLKDKTLLYCVGELFSSFDAYLTQSSAITFLEPAKYRAQDSFHRMTLSVSGVFLLAAMALEPYISDEFLTRLRQSV